MSGLLTDTLTDKDKAVLALVAKGYRPAEIAIKLEIHRSTAQAYVNDICLKLSAKTVPHAVAIALGAGIIE